MLNCDDRHSRSPADVLDFIEYMKTEFGDVALHKVHKGHNLDQILISILVSDWIKQHGSSRVKFVPRNTANDRSVDYVYTNHT